VRRIDAEDVFPDDLPELRFDAAVVYRKSEFPSSNLKSRY
jgi:hypothetical protein